MGLSGGWWASSASFGHVLKPVDAPAYVHVIVTVEG